MTKALEVLGAQKVVGESAGTKGHAEASGDRGAEC
jgi:hypothetical protein